MALGCYVPRYLQASFKGTTFLCVEADSEHGRRGAEGEFPFSERTAYADLGRKIRRFHLKVRFRENSHLADARALIRTCESPGPGMLSHPHLGSIRVACKSIKVRNDLENGIGETEADLEFVEANSNFGGAGLSSIAATLNVGALSSAAATAFAAGYRPELLAPSQSRGLAGVAADMVGFIRTNLIEAVGISDNDRYWRTTQELIDIASEPVKVRNPDTAWLGIHGGLAAIDLFGRSPDTRLAAFRSIANRAATLPPAYPGTAAGQEAMASSTRVASTAYMVRAALERIGGTMQEGFAEYDRVMAVIETEADIAYRGCDNGLFLAIRNFVPEAQAAMLARTYGLPPVVAYEFGTGVMSIVAAHEIYGDARKFGVIETHNAGHGWRFLAGPSVNAPRPRDTLSSRN